MSGNLLPSYEYYGVQGVYCLTRDSSSQSIIIIF